MTSSVVSPPQQCTAADDAPGQSLGEGAAGITLLRTERARNGTGLWSDVHQAASQMIREPVTANPEACGLFWGAPAVAYALHTAGHPVYSSALEDLDTHVSAIVRVRLAAAVLRMDRGHLSETREFDLINGLSGLGVYLMHRHGDCLLLREVLAYLVRLATSSPAARPSGSAEPPGWWATGSPDRRQSPRWHGGHGNFGMAHGIAGPLALLSAAMRRGIIVHGHSNAITTICAWLDRWRITDGTLTSWPETISRDEHDAGVIRHRAAPRPSWCYGTPGVARAQQLAGFALADHRRQRLAEQALIDCCTDESQLLRLTDAGLCHGWAGLVHTVRRAAADSADPALTAKCAALSGRMRHHLHQRGMPAGNGFLDGRAGVLLVHFHADRSTAPVSRWDACLLTDG